MNAAREIVLRALLMKWDDLEKSEEFDTMIAPASPRAELCCPPETAICAR